MDVYTASLALANDVLPTELCRNPLPLLAAVIRVLSTSKESPQLPESSK